MGNGVEAFAEVQAKTSTALSMSTEDGILWQKVIGLV